MKNSSNDVFRNSTDFFDNRYYSVNKKMLSIFGLWPYQSDSEKRRRLIFICFLSMSAMVPQVRAMILTWGRLDTFVESYAALGTHIACDMKLLNALLYQRTLRSLLDRVRQDWENMRSLTQVNIMKEHGEIGRCWSIVWLSTVYVILTGWMTMTMIPKILDIIVPLNHTRPPFDIMPVDYGVDRVKYWWPIQVHTFVCVSAVILAMPAFDTLYMSLSQHACGMFEISRNDLDSVLEENEKLDLVLKPDYHDDPCYKQIVFCIQKHRQLLKYIRDIESTYTICMFVILGLNATGLSVTGYQAVAEDTPLEDSIRYTMFCIAILVHLFVVTLPGHWITCASVSIPNAAYGCRWYMMSLRSRKLITFLLRASIEPCTITAGKIYTMSFQTFCCVLQTSMSYLTMLTSMQ